LVCTLFFAFLSSIDEFKLHLGKGKRTCFHFYRGIVAVVVTDPKANRGSFHASVLYNLLFYKTKHGSGTYTFSLSFLLSPWLIIIWTSTVFLLPHLLAMSACTNTWTVKLVLSSHVREARNIAVKVVRHIEMPKQPSKSPFVIFKN